MSMKCQKCGSEMVEKEDYVYVIPDINLAVANLKAYVCPDGHVELPVESVDAIEKAEEEWRRLLKEKEKAKAEI